jgi:succinate-semialdehyde dehydrogenase/glutarate-semialdehyde dehydrogenase
MYIDGCSTEASDGVRCDSINPATGEVIGTYPAVTRADVDRVLAAAQKGKKTWAAASLQERANIMLQAAEILSRHKTEISELQCREMGKPLRMCQVEFEELPDIIRTSVAAAMHTYGTVYPDYKAGGRLGDFAATIVEPLGVVCCISPFNVPVGTLSFKIAPALIMGNAVIVKAPKDAALTVLRCVEIMNQAGFPAGVLQAVSTKGRDSTTYLVDTDKINAVSFTGSTDTGSKLVANSAPYFHHLILELGGNSAFIICADADLDQAVSESMQRTRNSGQICSVSKRFLVHNSIKEEYVKRLIAALSILKIGDPMDLSNDMGPCVSETAAKTVENQITLTVRQGGKLLYGGVRNGAFITPAVIEVTRETDIAKDMEVFGPVFAVIGFDTEEEAIEISNQSVYGLTGGVLAGDLKRGMQIASRIEAGSVVVNGGCSWRRDTMPFGGYKKSGLGREGIADILAEVSQKKTIVIKGL